MRSANPQISRICKSLHKIEKYAKNIFNKFVKTTALRYKWIRRNRRLIFLNHILERGDGKTGAPFTDTRRETFAKQALLSYQQFKSDFFSKRTLASCLVVSPAAGWPAALQLNSKRFCLPNFCLQIILLRCRQFFFTSCPNPFTPSPMAYF